MQDLVVTQNRRNCKIGTMLLEAAKKYGIEKGVDFFRTQDFPGNVDGLRFYERNGFNRQDKTAFTASTAITPRALFLP